MRGLGRIRKAMEKNKRAIVSLAQVEASISSRWSRAAHRRLMKAQWSIPPTPEHFDHQIDLYYLWQHSRSGMFVERGTFGSLAITGGDVLELCCGDGFNSRNFYSGKANSVLAVDFDPDAIATARKKNAAPNVDFQLRDIRTQMPEGKFDAVLWDAAIEHFTQEEIATILNNIKERLKPGAILAGFTIIEAAHGPSLSHHEYEFKSKEDLARILMPHFSRVKVFETEWAGLGYLYFWASEAVLPLSEGWKHQVEISRVS